MNETILVADDDPDIVSLLELYLTNSHYRVLKAYDGEQALQMLEAYAIDLLLLDVMMPRMDGLTACLQIRRKHRLPIIFLTAKGEEVDMVHGLSAGADDYVLKPFSPVLLLARISSLLRRCKQYAGQQGEQVLLLGELEIDAFACQVRLKGESLHLTPKEYEILYLLAANRGRVLSIQQILEQVWGDQEGGSDNSVMVHVANIRAKIEQDPKQPVYIKTVWGFGYKI